MIPDWIEEPAPATPGDTIATAHATPAGAGAGESIPDWLIELPEEPEPEAAGLQ